MLHLLHFTRSAPHHTHAPLRTYLHAHVLRSYLPSPLPSQHGLHRTPHTHPPTQAIQGELLRRQEDALLRNTLRPSSRNQDVRPRRYGRSRSRSPAKRSNNFRRRSRSPETEKRTFRPALPRPNRQDRLSACPICLGRHPHRTASCQATETWDGKKAICSRTTQGRILNERGTVICSDWQRPNRCTDTSGKHIHECSGCKSREHGADSCPLAQA